MKVILLTDVDGLGSRGDTVNVASGYARNYLFPTRRALKATAGTSKVSEEIRRRSVRKERQQHDEAQQRARRLEGVSLTIVANASEEGKLYGSVGQNDIAAELAKQNLDFEIGRHDVSLAEPIKSLGRYTVSIKLYKDVEASVEVWVVPRSEGEDASAPPVA
jgi:large subunit ribosomal protein L9